MAAGEPIRCKAAVCRAAGEPLAVEEVVVAPPAANEVRIRVVCTSLCHSDITFWRIKEHPEVFPRIFGHEAFGIVESVGVGVEGFSPGDAVVPTFLPQCGDCVDCRSDRSNVCSKLPHFAVEPGMPRDRAASRFTGAGGRRVNNFLGVSSFSQYTVVDVASLVKVDPACPPPMASLLSCGVSTGVGAAWRAAKVEAGSTVAIFGLGTVGLAVAEGARMMGASRIIGVDTNPDKKELGKEFGITDFVNPTELGGQPVHEVIKEMTSGGADYCFECVGLASLMEEAFRSSRDGWGKTVILGVEKHGAPVCVPSAEVLRGKCVIGSLFGGIKAREDIPVLAAKYLSKELELDKFVTHLVGLQEINEAFQLLIHGKSLRCVIWMHSSPPPP